ncbi:hypothetical protein [Pontibacter litorisediminis]|uniref:hypothetical protein n=1 Tax=Pontibacter litorisediminis TaxID=1846260 RepID=UPI0023EB6F04|nr:hypothetical protein [Pontibacter litorisediminis]
MKETIPTIDVNTTDIPRFDETEGLSFKFKGRKYLSWLYRAAFVLVVLNLIAIASKFYTDHPNAWGIIPQFELDNERNIPTYFSSFILLLSSALLFVVSVLKQRQFSRYTWHWRLLAIVFLYMSVDESAGVHEMLIYPLRDNFQFGGIFYFSWVIVGAVLVLGLGLYYLRFLLALEPPLKMGLLLAGALYVGGALGVELLGGYYADTYGLDNFTYGLITTAEETLEILGVLTLLNVLYNYLERQLSSVRLNLRPTAAAADFSREPTPKLHVSRQLEKLN